MIPLIYDDKIAGYAEGCKSAFRLFWDKPQHIDQFSFEIRRDDIGAAISMIARDSWQRV